MYAHQNTSRWHHLLPAVRKLFMSLILLSTFFSVAAQEPGNVKGVIRNQKGEPLPGVTVGVYNADSVATETTVTNASGEFTLKTLKAGTSYNLRFSSVGYEEKRINNYRYSGGENIDLSLQLAASSDALSEVVVIGYGTQKKLNLTGAIASVSGDVLENRALPNISQGLQGVIPNLNLRPGDGKPIQAPAYNIRGTTSIGQGGNALVLIDGVEGDPSMINPADVASISVLKDAASAAIYGARGSFGVVLITTKNPAKGRTSITYSVNQSIKKPVTIPDFVTDGYQFAKYFNEAWSAWNDYSQTPQNVNKTVKFSPAYLAIPVFRKLK